MCVDMRLDAPTHAVAPPGADTVLADLAAGESAIPLTAVPDLDVIPRIGGRKPHRRCAFRWASRGVGGHRLAVARTPGGLVTTRPAVLRFFAALSGAEPTRPRASRRAAEQARARLQREGF